MIGNTQKGFLKDRYIEENACLVYDIMSALKTSGSKGFLKSLDSKNAFSSLWGVPLKPRGGCKSWGTRDENHKKAGSVTFPDKT